MESKGTKGEDGERPRRILYADHTSVLAGGEIALLELIRTLDRERFTPVVALLSDGPFAVELRTIGVETHILATPRDLLDARKDSIGGKSFLKMRAAMSTVFALRRVIKQTKADIVHANSLKADILAGIAGRLSGVKLIWHIRDRVADDYLSPFATKLIRTLAGILPHHIVANSNATLQTVQLKKTRNGSAIYSGLDLGPFAAIPARPLPANPIIGIVGRFTEWKGQHIFLQAAAILRNEFPAARFRLIGSPLFGETDYEASLHQLAKSLGIEAITDFAGFRRDIAVAVGELDLFVHASITAEPFGQVVVQAMAAGKPVVATHGGGIPEIVEHDVSGKLVPMNDAPAMAGAIAELLRKPDESARVAKNARERALERFSIQRTANQMMDLYDSLLNK